MLELSEQLRSPKFASVLGIGYSFGEKTRPLVVLDSRRIGVPPAPRPLELRQLPQNVIDEVEGPFADFPDALYMPIGRPEPLSGAATGGVVGARDSRERATLGPRIVRALDDGRWQPGFLSAGHGFPRGPGTEVLRLPRAWLASRWTELLRRRTAPVLGRVVACEAPLDEPEPPPAYDYAVVDIDRADEGDWDPRAFHPDLRHVGGFQRAHMVRIHGGPTGTTEEVSLSAGLTALGDWLDCWQVGPTDALEPGDSGSVVVERDTGETIGVVVGRAAHAGQAHHIYAQSLERLMAERLAPQGIRVEPFVRGGT